MQICGQFFQELFLQIFWKLSIMFCLDILYKSDSWIYLEQFLQLKIRAFVFAFGSETVYLKLRMHFWLYVYLQPTFLRVGINSFFRLCKRLRFYGQVNLAQIDFEIELTIGIKTKQFYPVQGLKCMTSVFHDFPVKQFEMLHCVRRPQVNQIDWT